MRRFEACPSKASRGLKLKVEPFKATFTYDGATLTRGKMRLHVSKCEVEGIDFEVPIEYATLLLYEGTKNESWRFLKEASKSPIMDSVRTALLRTVCKEGFEKAWEMLKTFNREAPRGKPRFYSEPSERIFQSPTVEPTLLTSPQVARCLIFHNRRCLISITNRRVVLLNDFGRLAFPPIT